MIRHVIAVDGVRGLWRGCVPGMARAATLTAAQCATYDEAKQAIVKASGSVHGANAHQLPLCARRACCLVVLHR